MEGCPHTIKGDFLLNKAILRNLEGGPRVVEEDYHVSDVRSLSSFNGVPDSVGADVYLDVTGPKIIDYFHHVVFDSI